MKIAQIVCTFPPYKGGMGNSVFWIAKKLSEKGEHLEIFTPYGKKETEENFFINKLKPILKIGNACILPQLLWKLKDFDIIHLHLPFIGSTWPLLFVPKKKLVVTYHMDLIGKGFKGLLFWKYKKIILPLILRRAQKIIVSSLDYAKHSDIAKFYKKNSNKFSEIPFGVDEHKFYPKEKDAKLIKKYSLDEKNKIMLFVGGLDKAHYFKGLEILFQAVRGIQDKNIKLLIVGKGGLKERYKKLAKEFGIEKQIIFCGAVSDSEIASHYNLTDVFVLPSIERSEAFGIVLLEAGACAKPLVASDLPGVRTVLWNGENGFLAEPKNPIDLKEKILSLLQNSQLKDKMGIKARQIIENNYTWDKIITHLIDVYKN